MGGPSNMSSDILGIEVGRRVIRGVRLDQETTELTAAAEFVFDEQGVSADGIIDPVAVGPALDQLIDHLGVQDRAVVRVGFTIGPRNAGVGSGPSMSSWLEAQAVNLREPMVCSGGLGVSFVPTRAVDAALKLASGSGIDLVRIDLAPVAGARAIGDQVEDVICLGSGRGWQARMRDFEVLEAMENVEIGDDDSLSIVGSSGPPKTIKRYGWVEVAAELDQAQRLEIGQLAPAVGAAIGVAYESPANLLMGKEVACGLRELKPVDYGLDPADFDLAGNVGEQTLQLAHKITIQPNPQADATVAPQRIEVPPKRREPVHAPTPKPTPAAVPAPTPNPLASPASADAGALAPDPRTIAEAGRPEHLRRIAPPRTGGLSPLTQAKERTVHPEESGRDAWGETVDESDPITMFSPESEVKHMLGKRDTRFNLDVIFGLLLISAIVLLLVYRYL